MIGARKNMDRSAFERINRPLAGAFNKFAAAIAKEADLQGKFLNTLSMLEHMGSARILATQCGPSVSSRTLKHLAEETRHAYFFKRHAERVAGKSLCYDNADMIAAPYARLYFRRTETMIVRACRDCGAPRQVPYLCTSSLIEYRAVWAYSAIQKVLNESQPPFSLNSVLAEESGHLSQMEGELAHWPSIRLAAFFDSERDLFLKFFDRLAIECNA